MISKYCSIKDIDIWVHEPHSERLVVVPVSYPVDLTLAVKEDDEWFLYFEHKRGNWHSCYNNGLNQIPGQIIKKLERGLIETDQVEFLDEAAANELSYKLYRKLIWEVEKTLKRK